MTVHHHVESAFTIAGIRKLRTLQRRFLAWRLKSGPDCEVFFPQTHVPGEQGQSDFTDMRELEVVIAGEKFSPQLPTRFSR